MIQQCQYHWIVKRTIVTAILIGCAILFSCGDEGEVVQPTSDGQIPPASDGQIPPASDGQILPPSGEQVPPSSDGQMPPLSDVPMPPGSDGQMPPPSGEQPPPGGEQMPPAGGGEDPGQMQEKPPPQPVALPGLPEDLAGFDQWLKLNKNPIPSTGGGDPHNGTKNIYINQKLEVIAPNGKQKFPYPDGSIIVKEAVSPGKDFIGLIATMRKIKGIDPAHNDWQFVEFTRNAKDKAFREIARGGVCWGCHSAAANTDYVQVFQ